MSNNYADGGVYYDPDTGPGLTPYIDNNKRQKRGDGSSAAVPGSNSSWIMYEYWLPDENTFQELVLCKIRKITNSKDEEVEAVDVTNDAEEDGT
uniref:NAC domain-containing protein n=1 Tax=Brassica oleracea TaxID=3712 RepID=A0A3P6D1F1_BRAOL|nr:unnamed protein product [Brassica oleracea]